VRVRARVRSGCGSAFVLSYRGEGIFLWLATSLCVRDTGSQCECGESESGKVYSGEGSAKVWMGDVSCA